MNCVGQSCTLNSPLSQPVVNFFRTQIVVSVPHGRDHVVQKSVEVQSRTQLLAQLVHVRAVAAGVQNTPTEGTNCEAERRDIDPARNDRRRSESSGNFRRIEEGELM